MQDLGSQSVKIFSILSHNLSHMRLPKRNIAVKISYSIYVKNKARGGTNWYARIRESNKTLDLNLSTTERPVAESWLAHARQSVSLVNSLEEQGLPVPPELASKVVHAVKQTVQQTVQEVTIQTAIDEYLNHLAVTGRRQTSLDVYKRAYKVIFEGVGTTSLRDLDSALVTRLLAKFVDRTDNHRRNMANRVRTLLQFVSETYDIDVRKAVKSAASVKVDEKEVRFWTADEMTRIINCTSGEITKLYFATLASTGMRHTECYLAEFRDLKDGCLVLRAETTKGRKSRTVPLTVDLFARLSKLRAERPLEARIFSGVPSTQSGRHDALQRAITAANRASRPENQIEAGGLHQFRRSAAILLYKSSHLDIKTVATILGHSAEVSLKYYQAARGAADTVAAVRAAVEDSGLGLPGQLDDMLDLL